MMPYMSLTAHFIDSEWKLVLKCLTTSFHPENHSADNLAAVLQEQLQEWKVAQWGSKQRMVDRILQQAQAIRQVQTDDRRASHSTLTWQDIQVLESVNKVLKPVADFTDIMSGESYVTASSLLPMMQLLRADTMAAAAEDSNKECKERSTGVLNQLDKRYQNQAMIEILEMTTFLDPHYRNECTESDTVKTAAGGDGDFLEAEPARHNPSGGGQCWQ
ncbi:hypothetical protein SKAU_G00244640 [Synaphobranchus kaupii]|uniref:Uncharacterized protein n=1 Tax=Synaphobranchus kaupii TaxID=118154 RepID=A0A9Q1F1M2_SYNKA|nr:hypothetical protein SKAU_G00244640 [Synaphobranchus kaupii]